MTRYEVVIPKPEEQHLKNVKWKLVDETVLDEKGSPVTVKVKKPLVKTTSPLAYEMGGEPVWGLGCPAGCGRLWEFTADAVDLVEETDTDGVKRMWPRGRSTSHFRPRDSAAYSGMDENGNPTKGYLNFHPDPSTPSSVKMFTCDRCGAEIRMVKQ